MATMRAFLALTFLATLDILQAKADLGHIRPNHLVVDVDPKHTALEWYNVMAAQRPSPEELAGSQNGTKPQPDFASKVHVPNSDLRITNDYIAKRGQFPWQVALIVSESSFCGGSLISSQWILTAAHCTGSTYRIKLGANRWDIPETGSLEVTSRNSTKHENYDPYRIRNDIAVVLLPWSVTSTIYIRPVRLPTRAQQGNSFFGQTLHASGWGKVSDSSSAVTSQLQFVDLTPITNDMCATAFGTYITSSHLCAITLNGQSTCNGDSGGPLVYYEYDRFYTLVGIVSFGSSVGCQMGYPAVFTRVTNYLNWIQSTTRITIAN